MKNSDHLRLEQGSAEKAVVDVATWIEMTDNEIEIAARNIIITSSSEAEVHKRLLDELGYSGMALRTNIPTDLVGKEARDLARGMGGLVMKNGAMAMAMMHGHDGIIHL